MNFQLKLPNDYISLEPGISSVCNVVVLINTTEEDSYELSVTGVDSEWIVLPVQSFTDRKKGEYNERIVFKAPKLSESLSGCYPFVVQLRSIHSGEIVECSGILEILPYHSLSVDVKTKNRIISSFRCCCDIDVELHNGGNTTECVSLVASDVEDLLDITFPENNLLLVPGAKRVVKGSVRSKKRMFNTFNVLHYISLYVQDSEGNRLLSKVDFSIEQRFLLKPYSLLLSVLCMLLITIWYMLLPMNPEIKRFQVSSEDIYLGESVELEWDTNYANKFIIQIDNNLLFPHLSASGKKVFKPTKIGDYHLVGKAVRGNKSVYSQESILKVKEPTVVPEPEIIKFESSAKSVPLGETVLFHYLCNGATKKLVLHPLQQSLDPKSKVVEVFPRRCGDLVYKLVAENKKGVRTEKSLSLSVKQVSEAKIIAFYSKKDNKNNHSFRIYWQVEKGVRAELLYRDKVHVVENMCGSILMDLDKNTEFILKGYDKKGISTEERISVYLEDEKSEHTI